MGKIQLVVISIAEVVAGNEDPLQLTPFNPGQRYRVQSDISITQIEEAKDDRDWGLVERLINVIIEL